VLSHLSEYSNDHFFGLATLNIVIVNNLELYLNSIAFIKVTVFDAAEKSGKIFVNILPVMFVM
jgi:hypothetical protein